MVYASKQVKHLRPVYLTCFISLDKFQMSGFDIPVSPGTFSKLKEKFKTNQTSIVLSMHISVWLLRQISCGLKSKLLNR